MKSTKQIGQLNIIGIELKTTNENGKAFQDIPPFWQKFYQENYAEKIPSKTSNDIYAVYTNFQNQGENNAGIYSLIIGCMVESLDDIPEGFVSTVIPQSEYAVFGVENGNPEKVGEKWQEIWKLSEEDKNFNQMRSYISEFEHYTSSGKITICIGLK